MRMAASDSTLVVVDLHVRLVPKIHDRASVVERTLTLIRAASRLGVPVVITEHCAERLGPTVPEILDAAPAGAVVAKTHFSGADEAAVSARIESLGRRQLVLAGTEAHVCVMQTALGFAARGYEVFAVGDAMGSRAPQSREAALARLAMHRIDVVTAEMVVFEWLDRADRPEFRELLPLVR